MALDNYLIYVVTYGTRIKDDLSNIDKIKRRNAILSIESSLDDAKAYIAKHFPVFHRVGFGFYCYATPKNEVLHINVLARPKFEKALK